MLSVQEALTLVLDYAAAKSASNVALWDALGLVLAEDIASDIDSPPHDKSLVDGYAVRSADLKDGRASLQILEEVTAGQVPRLAIGPGTATRIMTGAPIPDGADAVVMVERTSFSPAIHGGTILGIVEIDEERFRADQNIIPRGKSMHRGDIVLKQGTPLGPAEIGLLAEAGRSQIQVIAPVQVAILSTGNELVTASETPGPGQIRNSNGPLLVASAAKPAPCPSIWASPAMMNRSYGVRSKPVCKATC